MPGNLPSQVLFLIAELLRPDLGNKINIMGAFAAGQILVNPGTAFPVFLPFAIYSVFDGGDGKFKVRVRISEQNGNPIIDSADLPDAEKLPEAPMQMMINFNVLRFPSPGRYKVEIFLDNHVYANDISIRISDKPII